MKTQKTHYQYTLQADTAFPGHVFPMFCAMTELPSGYRPPRSTTDVSEVICRHCLRKLTAAQPPRTPAKV